MDFVTVVQALILGLVEGLTEFLPISSTGHLIVAGHLLGHQGSQAETTDIVIQLGAILAVCWHYRVKLRELLCTVHRSRSSQAFVGSLLLAFLPAAILGLLLHGLIKRHLFQPQTVALALIVGGILMLIIERRPRSARVHSLDELRWPEALKLGCAQTLALIPGMSRSGATIMGGLLCGLSRQTATEFSFFLALPTMFAATGYDLLKSWAALSSDDLLFMALAFAVAFASALLAIRQLLWYVARHDFKLFAWYRIGFGLVILALFS